MAGIDVNGLTIKRFQEILSDLITAEQANIDANIVTTDGTLLGQYNKIISEAMASLWELSQAVNDNFNIDYAEGKNLDDLAALRYVTRLDAVKTSTSKFRFIGADGILIPAGSRFSNPSTRDVFSNPLDITNSATDCISATVSVVTLIDEADYVITINDVVYTYTADVSVTAAEVVAGLDALIDADVTATWTSTVSGETLIITTDDDDDPINVSLLAYMQASSVTSYGYVEAEETGPIVAPALSVSVANNVIAGLTSSVNPYPMDIGRDVETDDELRVRIADTANTAGTGTVPAIEAAILNTVDNVTYVRVIENTTGVDDVDGRDPHSYEVIVRGGTDADVATKIWETKPAGTPLWLNPVGGITEQITDTSGTLRDINFTRPVPVYLAIRVTYTLYDEETFPSDGDDLIIAAVVNYTGAVPLDKDVIPSRYFGGIYSTVDGIDSLVVEVQELAAPNDPPVELDWQTTKIAIADSEYASVIASDVYVVDATPP